MKNSILTIIILIGMSMNAFAVTKSHRELRGDKYYFVYSFEKAICCYTHSKPLSTEGQRRLAKSYSNLNENAKSEAAYSVLLTSSEGLVPDDYFNYVLVLKSNGKYSEANTWMEKFEQLYPEDLRAKSYEAHEGSLSELSTDNGTFGITTLSVNSAAEDFGPSYYNGKIAFASDRAKGHMIVRKSNWNGKPYFDNYVSDMDGVQLKKPVMMDKELNGKWHDGPASFSKDGNTVAFTRNNYDVARKNKIVQLQIYFSNYVNGDWTEPVPFELNSLDYSVGQPNLNADGTIMYFTSDMPGGFGGSDIYRVSKGSNGQWGSAENLGNSVNTESDEMFPFYQEKNNVLFFSSNGLFGLGGLDIFYCAVNGSSVGKVVNAGAPLNTRADDFGIIVDENLKTGYFSSDREGGSGGDDLYAVSILKDLGLGKKIEGIAMDKNGVAVPATFITLFDDKGKVLDTLTSKADGSYSFLVASGKSFRLAGRKAEYADGENTFNTFGSDLIVKSNVTLVKNEVVVAEVVPVIKDVDGDVILNTIYFDLNKCDIRPDAAKGLDKIVAIMNADPDMVVRLKSYTDCRASTEYNQVLSNNRADASLDYIKARITNPGRITGKGYSETMLTNTCDCDGDAAADCTDAEHQKNRRTEFVVVRK
jgi:outer membrane protein OmpA-like peptidoglycan-associated protein